MEMHIFLPSSDAGSFRKWSKEHQTGSNDDDIPGGATPIAVVKPPSGRDAREDRSHRPWLIPGVGGSF
jgi:hypothetical protein